MLMSTFFCQKLVKIFHAVIDGELPTNLVLPLLALGIPEMEQLILPLSLFFGLLTTFSKLCTESEIVVMHACGLNKISLVKVAMILALFTSIITTFNLIIAEPWSFHQQNKILAKIKNNPSIATLARGQFKKINDGNSILFIKSIHKDKLKNIFLAKLHSNNNIHPSIVVANSGQIVHYKNGSQIITLNNGVYLEIIKNIHNFYITTFQKYQVVINCQNVIANYHNNKQIDIITLWNTNSNRARIELHWRLTLIFVLFIISLMVIPLSTINQRRRRIIYILLTMLLYLMFFLIQTFIRSNDNKDKFNSVLWIWIINIFYLFLVILLNLWDTILMRRMRAYFTYKNI